MDAGEVLKGRFETSLLDFDPIYIGPTLLSEVAKSLPDSSTVLNIKGQKVEFKSGSFKGKINCSKEPESWMDIGHIKFIPLAEFSINNEEFRKVLQSTHANVQNNNVAHDVRNNVSFKHLGAGFSVAACSFDSLLHTELYAEVLEGGEEPDTGLGLFINLYSSSYYR